MWGPVGLVLATPLTVCLVVLGRHVERFEDLDVMLGTSQRSLPLNCSISACSPKIPLKRCDKAEDSLKERPRPSYHDDVALPGLRLA